MTLRTAALNLLQLAGFHSIRAGMQAVTHDITALQAMAMREPEPSSNYGFKSALARHTPRWSGLMGRTIHRPQPAAPVRECPRCGVVRRP